MTKQNLIKEREMMDKSEKRTWTKRFNDYLLNSCKVAILGFVWYGLFKFPWKSLVNAPLGGKIFVGVVMWAIWSFMVIIVDGQLDGARRK